MDYFVIFSILHKPDIFKRSGTDEYFIVYDKES